MKSVIISAMAFLAALVAHNANADVSYGSAVGDIFYTEANTKQDVGLSAFGLTNVDSDRVSVVGVGSVTGYDSTVIDLGFVDSSVIGNAKLKQQFNVNVSSSWQLTDTSKRTRKTGTCLFVSVSAGAQWGGDAHVTFDEQRWRYSSDKFDTTDTIRTYASYIGESEQKVVDVYNAGEDLLKDVQGFTPDYIEGYTKHHYSEFKNKTNYTASIKLTLKF